MTHSHACHGWTLGCALFLLLFALPVVAADPEPAKPATLPAVQSTGQPDNKGSDDSKKSDAAEDPSEDKPAARPDDAAHDRETLELLKIFVDSLDQIERNYVKTVDRRELMEAAIQGMLEKLDPHSTYIAPKEVDRFRSVVESQFGGIGIQVNTEQGQLKIVSPLVGTPAYRAGLLAGDVIIEIEGKAVSGIAIDEAVRRLKGPVGSKVTVTVLHAGSNKKQTATLTREIIHVETVLGDRRAPDDKWDFMFDKEKRIGYIRVTSFGRDTVRDLQRALTQLQNDKMRGLVLDLRFNPGGLLTSAIETCDLFIDKGRIVSTKGRNVKERTWDAKADSTFAGFPMAILLNHYSASASEIVSACLQDHHRAVIVGERSWGKGSVQNVIDLEDGKSVLKLTTASYWRPNGKNIHRFPDAKESDEWGVRPDKDYEVALAADDLRQLLEDRRDRDIVQPHPNAETALPQLPAAKGNAPAEAAKNQSTKTENPAAEKPAEGNQPEAAKPAKPAPYVDRQLQRALEYLTVELARAS